MGDGTRLAILIASLLVAGASAACGPEVQPAPPPAAPAPYKPKTHAPGPMDGVRATQMGDMLAAAGLDVRNLPPLEKLTLAQKQKVMRTFTETLGVPCLGCHAEDDFPADTRRKRVAKRMFNEVVRVLTLRDGEPVYCDSCHDGRMHMLDRRDTAMVTRHMSQNLVGQMARVDGRLHDCDTCHGDPPDFQILTTWKKSTAPEILLEGATPNGAVFSPYLPTPGPRVPADCGATSEQCPLQGVMRGAVSSAMAAGDGPALASALDEVARFSPEPSWEWAKICAKGAAAARAGNLEGARESCATCHALYKVTWRETHRTRKAP